MAKRYQEALLAVKQFTGAPLDRFKALLAAAIEEDLQCAIDAPTERRNQLLDGVRRLRDLKAELERPDFHPSPDRRDTR